MVIVYDKTTKEKIRTEDNTMLLTVPLGTLQEQKASLALDNQDFVAIPYELGIYIWDYDLSFNENGAFVGLQPKTTAI